MSSFSKFFSLMDPPKSYQQYIQETHMTVVTPTTTKDKEANVLSQEDYEQVLKDAAALQQELCARPDEFIVWGFEPSVEQIDSMEASRALNIRTLLLSASQSSSAGVSEADYEVWLQHHPTGNISYEEWRDVHADACRLTSSWKSSLPSHTTVRNQWKGDEPCSRPCVKESDGYVAVVASVEDPHYMAIIGELYGPGCGECDLPDGVLRGVDVSDGKEGTWFQQVDGSWIFEYDILKGDDGFKGTRCVVAIADRNDEDVNYTWLLEPYTIGA